MTGFSKVCDFQKLRKKFKLLEYYTLVTSVDLKCSKHLEIAFSRMFSKNARGPVLDTSKRGLSFNTFTGFISTQ